MAKGLESAFSNFALVGSRSSGRSWSKPTSIEKLDQPRRIRIAIRPNMGLDAVEMVFRIEELFVISVEDDEAASVRTVGDFYKLICAKLGVPPLQSPVTPANLPVVTEKKKAFLLLQKQTPLPAPPEVLPWSPQSVWDSLVAVIVDQLCLKPGEVLYHARLDEDLRVD